MRQRETDDLFWTNCDSTPYNRFSLIPSLSIALWRPFPLFLCLPFLLSHPLEIESQKWIPPKAHTQPHTLFHSSALRNSLHPLPISVSCFLHACSRLFVCRPALKGRPSVRRFLFSLDRRSRKCRAAGFSVHLNQQQNTLTFPLPARGKHNSAHWVVVAVQRHSLKVAFNKRQLLLL